MSKECQQKASLHSQGVDMDNVEIEFPNWVAKANDGDAYELKVVIDNHQVASILSPLACDPYKQ